MKYALRKNLLTAAIVVAASRALAQDPTVGGESMFKWQSFTTGAVDPQQYSTLTAAVKASGLDQTVTGSAPYTIFAPTNSAFNQLPNGAVATLLTPDKKEELSTLLQCHVIPGKFTYDDLMMKINAADGKLTMKTLGGCQLVFTDMGKSIQIEDAFGTTADITSEAVDLENGTLFAVNQVLLPASLENEVRASRIFAGPTEYPPANFAAYGILAFKSKATSYDLDRHKMICEAYLSAVPTPSSLVVPMSDQMVTVWPMDTVDNAKAATKAPVKKTCDIAISGYGLATSLKAIKDATASGATLDSAGPFLIAWSPPSSIGQPSAVVLLADLSTVTDYELASEIMLKWVNEIQSKPELWKPNGFTRGRLAGIRDWLDRNGEKLLSILGD